MFAIQGNNFSLLRRNKKLALSGGIKEKKKEGILKTYSKEK